MTPDLDARLARASEIAKEAGALALHHFQNRDRLAIETKRHVTDLVSEADRAVEVLIRDALIAAFPADWHSEAVGLVEPLSPRELEVLRLIAAGLSNKQITVELTVSLNTVKKHTSHIYEKLGVNGRTQAIVRARELNLL